MAPIVKVCDFCGLERSKFTNPEVYREHFKVHLNESFNCSECGKSFPTKIKLRDHVRFTHNAKYPCDCCDKFFTTKGNLKQHKVVDKKNLKDEKQCPICSKTLKNLQNLKRHQKLHTNLEDIECDQCKKSFKTKNALSAHIVNEHKSNNTCSVCTKVFKHKNSLTTHMNTIHSTIQSFGDSYAS